MSKHPSYRAWQCMHSRINNSNNASYKRYGARGLTICTEWYDINNFIKDMGIRPSNKHSLGRKNNNKGYSKINCRWETVIQQENNKSTNIHNTYMGLTYTIAEWENLLKFKKGILRGRLRTLSLEESIFYEAEKDMRILFKGKKQTISKWAKELNLSFSTIRQRLFKLNWTVNKTFTISNLRKNIPKIRNLTVNGKINTIRYWSERFNISRETISYRIDKLNMSETEAVTIPIIRKRK